jgi:hypothetical protein
MNKGLYRYDPETKQFRRREVRSSPVELTASEEPGEYRQPLRRKHRSRKLRVTFWIIAIGLAVGCLLFLLIQLKKAPKGEALGIQPAGDQRQGFPFSSPP